MNLIDLGIAATYYAQHVGLGLAAIAVLIFAERANTTIEADR